MSQPRLSAHSMPAIQLSSSTMASKRLSSVWARYMSASGALPTSSPGR